MPGNLAEEPRSDPQAMAMATLNADIGETEPLLPDRHVVSTIDMPETERERQPPSGDFLLFCSLLVDSIPVILSYMLQNSIQAVSILIAARLGPGELSAASVALMLAFVTGESLDCFTCRNHDPTFCYIVQAGALHSVDQPLSTPSDRNLLLVGVVPQTCPFTSSDALYYCGLF